MTWEQRYRLLQTTRTSLVFWGTLALAAALCCAPVIQLMDKQTEWAVFRYSTEGARAVLGMLAGSMLTFLVFVLSATLIVVQLASVQLTPRIITLVLTTRGVKIALAALTFTYAYTLSALARVEEHVPDLHVSVAVLLNLGCLLIFFYFVQQLSGGLRPGSVVLLVANRTTCVIEQVYPAAYDDAVSEHAVGDSLPPVPGSVIDFAGRSGVVMAFNLKRLNQLATASDVIIELVPQVGDSITRGQPLFRVYGECSSNFSASVRGCVAVGTERTLDQDPRFGFRILADIANKALSHAINDPTTAVLAIDQIEHLLVNIGRRRLDEGVARDDTGKTRVVYGTPNWPDYITMAVTEIRQYGEGSLQVIRRMRAMLANLISTLPESRLQPLRQEVELLNTAVARRFPDEADRKLAGVADFQGVGGSES